MNMFEYDTDPVQTIIDGRNMWLWPNGTKVPVVSGGSDLPPAPMPSGPTPGVDAPPTPGDVITIPKETAPPPSGEPGAEPPVSTKPEGKRFTEADIERARKEEKDKLYPVLNETKAELEALRKEREEREAAAAAAQAKAEEDARKKAEEEMSAKELLAQKEQEWEQRFNALQTNAQRQEALLQREREYASLQQYRAEVLAVASENILPELLDEVQGNTPEEIDAAITRMTEKSASILANIAAVQQQQRAGMRGVSATAPPVGPMDTNPEYDTLTAEDIRDMDMSQYSKMRHRLLPAASQRVTNKGLYG